MMKEEDLRIQCRGCYDIKRKNMFVFEAIKISRREGIIELPFICKKCYVSKKRLSRCQCSFCGAQIYKEGYTVCTKCEYKL